MIVQLHGYFPVFVHGGHGATIRGLALVMVQVPSPKLPCLFIPATAVDAVPTMPADVATPGGLTKDGGVQEWFEKECQMALQGRIQEQTNEAKNALEAYIYSTRSKLADPWADFATDSERSSLGERLTTMEVRVVAASCTVHLCGW